MAMAIAMNHGGGSRGGGGGVLAMVTPGTSSHCLPCWHHRQHLEACIGSPGVARSSGSMNSMARTRLRSPVRCHSDRIELNEEDAILSLKAVSAKRFEEHLDKQKRQSGPASEWQSWQEHFTKVEEEANLIEALKFQLDEAVRLENFQEAAKLNAALESAKSSDVILQVANELQRALREERYKDAAQLRDVAGAGLVGWWSGLSEDSSDPFGRIIKVRAAYGRLIAEGYSARQLATAAPGTPLFEVYVKNAGENHFHTQAVYLHRDIVQQSTLTEDVDKLDVIDTDEDIAGKVEKLTEQVEENVKNEKAGTSEEANKTRKGINDIVNFLKDRIPQLGMKVIRVVAPEGSEPDIPKIIEEIIETEQEDQDEASIVIEAASSDDSAAKTDENVSVRVIIGGPESSNSGNESNAPIMRLPATIDCKTKDSFLFRVDNTAVAAAAAAKESSGQNRPRTWKVAKVTTRVAADQVPDDVAQMLLNVEQMPVQASNDLKEIIRLAVGQAQSKDSLTGSTVFRRINVIDSGDPFNGLYIGSFGANALEVIQLSRKYGHWDEQNGRSETDKLRFYEYVEAVKLTGDMKVPASKVSFRAKIGREHKLSPYGVYPEELGVIGRYKGEGQLADPGYKNPRWTEGELVLLDGRKNGPTNGAKLGFVFCLPEHHFLILFDRLNLANL